MWWPIEVLPERNVEDFVSHILIHVPQDVVCSIANVLIAIDNGDSLIALDSSDHQSVEGAEVSEFCPFFVARVVESGH